MIIEDEIETITFRNEENGYSVVRLADSGVTAVGILPYALVGQGIKLTGEWVKNAKFGQQFSIASAEIVVPKQASKIREFLASGLISGVGPVTAANIVKKFGDETLQVIEMSPDKLSDVKGVSEKKAARIADEFSKLKEMQNAVMFLQKFEISLNLAVRIYDHYKQKTIEVVQRNPYALIETIDGIGFLTADKMAATLGVQYNGTFRVRAGVVYCLKMAAERDGHTYLGRQKLTMDVCKLLKIKMENLLPVLDDVLRNLELDAYVKQIGKDSSPEAMNDKTKVMLSKFYNAERAIATKLCLLAAEQQNQVSIDSLIKHYEQLNKLKLHAKQKEAISTAINNGVSVITGGPGTGKTTIVKAIISILLQDNKKIMLLAPTGRAAKRLEETTGMTAATIHRGLDLKFKGDKTMFMPDDSQSHVDADVVIVDEISMCDCMLMNVLLKKLLRTTKLILVGDADQLPSVGAGNVLADILASGVVPSVRLTEIYRQSEQSHIVLNAHAINNGEMPNLSNKSEDFFFESCESQMQIRDKVVSLVTQRLPKFLKGKDSSPAAMNDNMSMQVLCPLKAGDAGVLSLNEVLQAAINPFNPNKKEIGFGRIVFREGDRVMQTVNNYDMEWEKQDARGVITFGDGIFNGDMGIIANINTQTGEIRVVLDDNRIAIYSRSDLANLVLAYAITVHKSQGCEFDVCVIPVVSGAYLILTRNLLYTAITRAKKLVVLVGSAENVEKMVNNTFTKSRYSMLKDFLVLEKNKVENAFIE